MPALPCPACGRRLAAPAAAAGKTVRCPGCQHRFPVPDIEPAEPPAPAVQKKRRKRKPAKPDYRPLLIGAGVLGAVATCVAVAVALGGKPAAGGRAADPAGSAVEALDIRREPAAVAVAAVAGPLPTARPAEWRVTADPAPDPGPLTVPVVDDREGVFEFVTGGPGSAAAAFLQPGDVGRLTWHRLDLKAGTVVGRAIVTVDGTPKARLVPDQRLQPVLAPRADWPAADLHPAGDRLALRVNTTPDAITVSPAAGPSRTLRPVPGTAVEWVRFAGDALLALAGGKLYRYDQADTPTYQVGGGLAAAALTPGRKYVAAAAADRLDWYEAATGRPAGSLPYPEPPAGRTADGVAVSADGTRVAVSMRSDGGQQVFVWDVTDGTPLANFTVTTGHWMMSRDLPVFWLGRDLLLADGGGVYDIGRKRAVWAYTADRAVRVAPTSPDGRLWYWQHYALKAVRLPHPAVGQGAAVEPHPLLQPGAAVRLEATGPESLRRPFAELVANRLAAAGVRVTPDAPAAVRVSVTEPRETTMRARETARTGDDFFVNVAAQELAVTVTATGPAGEPLGRPTRQVVTLRDYEKPGPNLGWPEPTTGPLRPTREKLVEEMAARLRALDLRQSWEADPADPRRGAVPGCDYSEAK